MQLSGIVFVYQYNPNCQLKTLVISFVDCFLKFKVFNKVYLLLDCKNYYLTSI